MNDDLPLVSLAIPLYKSLPFVDIITTNIQALTYPRLEILISDRHGADLALNLLQERHADDPRITFMRATDGINWIAHYNLLLRAAHGKYFAWLPHDDSYPANYIRALVTPLENETNVILAYGKVDKEFRTGTVTVDSGEPPFLPTDEWSWRAPARLLIHGRLWQGMRGIFRRDLVLERGLFFTADPRDSIRGSSLDVLARVTRTLSLDARDHRRQTLLCRKHARRWTNHTPRHTLSELVALKPLLVDSARGAWAKAQGAWLLGIWGVVRFGGDVLWMLKRHSHLHSSFQRVLAALLAPPHRAPKN